MTSPEIILRCLTECTSFLSCINVKQPFLSRGNSNLLYREPSTPPDFCPKWSISTSKNDHFHLPRRCHWVSSFSRIKKCNLLASSNIPWLERNSPTDRHYAETFEIRFSLLQSIYGIWVYGQLYKAGNSHQFSHSAMTGIIKYKIFVHHRNFTFYS